LLVATALIAFSIKISNLLIVLIILLHPEVLLIYLGFHNQSCQVVGQ
jgi:hypothetical protein